MCSSVIESSNLTDGRKNALNCAVLDNDPAEYTTNLIIGKGHNDSISVTLGRHKLSGRFVSIKKIHLDSENINFSLIQNEIVLVNQLRHRNLLPILSTFVFHHDVWVVTPLMEYGSCHDLMAAHFTDGLPEPCIAYILRDVLRAVDYLHTSFIIHRSIQASHILISAEGRVCLTGLRDAFPMIRHGVLSTVFHFPINDPRKLPWFSPELLEQNLTGYGTKSDIYSLGITACELANGYAPFSDIAPTLMLLEKVRGVKPVLFDSSTIPEIPENSLHNANQADSGLGCSVTNNQMYAIYHRLFSKHFHNLVSMSLERDPTKRPTAAVLLSQSMFKNLRKDTKLLPGLFHPVAPFKVADVAHEQLGSEDGDITEDMRNMSLADQWDFGTRNSRQKPH